ncbi:hypothetical protein B0H12DRAFT_743451 [Mycena haematopus]|nr:hypothetical protein B0H12DRAFT_743451 [Mycena haematopus]
MPIPVLVFGATGAVGSACARHAHSLGATVSLAVRDTKKPIPGLSWSRRRRAATSACRPTSLSPEPSSRPSHSQAPNTPSSTSSLLEFGTIHSK